MHKLGLQLKLPQGKCGFCFRCVVEMHWGREDEYIKIHEKDLLSAQHVHEGASASMGKFIYETIKCRIMKVVMK